MKSQFRQVALIGKYAAVSQAGAGSTREVLEEIAHFLHSQGCDVVVERDTAANSGIVGYPALDVEAVPAPPPVLDALPQEIGQFYLDANFVSCFSKTCSCN